MAYIIAEPCIGTKDTACVEVCPANVKNGGRTLRVMEAPTREFFEVLDTMTPRKVDV